MSSSETKFSTSLVACKITSNFSVTWENTIKRLHENMTKNIILCFIAIEFYSRRCHRSRSSFSLRFSALKYNFPYECASDFYFSLRLAGSIEKRFSSPFKKIHRGNVWSEREKLFSIIRIMMIYNSNYMGGAEKRNCTHFLIEQWLSIELWTQIKKF